MTLEIILDITHSISKVHFFNKRTSPHKPIKAAVIVVDISIGSWFSQSFESNFLYASSRLKELNLGYCNFVFSLVEIN
jgi:hypothetical protein